MTLWRVMVSTAYHKEPTVMSEHGTWDAALAEAQRLNAVVADTGPRYWPCGIEVVGVTVDGRKGEEDDA